MTWIIVISAALLVVALVLRSAWFRTREGEAELHLSARMHFTEKKGYHIIRNVRVPGETGDAPPIDHIVVSPFGVFVVETNNMKGDIFGGDRVGTWTQQSGRQSIAFENPLRQAGKHAKTLSDIVGVPLDKFKPIVVFVGDCEFKKPLPPNVTRRRGYIEHVQEHTRRILSDEEVQQILQRIAEKHLAPATKPASASPGKQRNP